MSYKTDSVINKRTSNPVFDAKFCDSYPNIGPAYEDEEHNNECMYAHGTSLYSLIQACKHTNAQFAAGEVLRKYKVPITSGESFGTTPLNYKYVSVVNIVPTQFMYIYGANAYAKSVKILDKQTLLSLSKNPYYVNESIQTFDPNQDAIKTIFNNEDDSTQYKNLSKIGITVLGDAPLNENSKVDKIKVISSIKYEVGIERLNTRIVLCDNEDYQIIIEELNKFPEFNFRVLTYDNQLLKKLINKSGFKPQLIPEQAQNWKELKALANIT